MRTIDDATVTTIVSLACRAPSVHNTQPWRLVWLGDRLELRSDDRRQLMYADPTGRNLVLSCGTLLHHLTVASAAAGWRATVDRLPDPNDPTLLATLRFTHRAPSAAHQRLATFIEYRSTDRRQVSAWPVPASRVAQLTAIAHDHGVLCNGALPSESKQILFDALPRANHIQSHTGKYLDELLAHSHTRNSIGVPVTNMLARPAAPDVDDSFTRFPVGTLENVVDPDAEGEATWMVLSTSSDDRLSWLRAGEALSAIWLTCTGAGWSLVPYSQPIEVDETRKVIQRSVLSDSSCPQLLLRIGWPALDRSPVPRTERLPVQDVLHLREETAASASW
jgi:hypothetical protein